MKPSRARVAIVLVAVAASAGATLFILTRAGDDRPTTTTGRVLVEGARFPAALAPLDDGGLLYGERLTGRILKVDPLGHLSPEPIAGVEVSTTGQRGLLGLALDRRQRVFAAWSRPDERLVVGRVAPGPVRLVWIGPRTTDVANGGHLAFSPEGRLVIGIGDLRAPELVADPTAPNGKLLALDPVGPPTQRPEVLSAGWNNPFAFAFTPEGDLWVADNSPGKRPERLGRGDVPNRPTTQLTRPTAPSGLAATSRSRLLLCGYITRTLQAYEISPDGRASPVGEPLATDCSIGVVVLSDRRIAYANEDTIRVLPP